MPPNCLFVRVGRDGRTSRRHRRRGGAYLRVWIVTDRGKRGCCSRSCKSDGLGVASSPTVAPEG